MLRFSAVLFLLFFSSHCYAATMEMDKILKMSGVQKISQVVEKDLIPFTQPCPQFLGGRVIEAEEYFLQLTDAFFDGQDNMQYSKEVESGDFARAGPFYSWSRENMYEFATAFQPDTFTSLSIDGLIITGEQAKTLLEKLCYAHEKSGGLRNLGIELERLFVSKNDRFIGSAANWNSFPYIETGNNIVKAPSVDGLSHYKKYTTTSGVIIVGGEKVKEEAMLAARRSIEYMLSARPDFHSILKENNTRIALFGPKGTSGDLPDFKGTREEGGAAQMLTDTAMTANSDWLCYEGNYDIGGDPVIHEMAHSIEHIIFDEIFETSFFEQILALAEPAIKAGKIGEYKKKSGRKKAEHLHYLLGEYWAMTVEGYIMDSGPRFKDSYYSREWIKENDPKLYELITKYFPTEKWDYCPGWEKYK